MTDAVSLSKEHSDLYRVRQTVFKMLRKRKYNISEEDYAMTREAFKTKFVDPSANSGDESQSLRELLTIQVQHVEDTDDQIFVFFPEDPKVGVQPVRKYCTRMKQHEATKGIIVVKEGITPFAKTAIDEMRPKYKLEHFKQIELLVDITEHELVPEHQVLNDEEKAKLLARYKLTESQLPRLQVNDPVARYFGLDRAQVVKIIRPSETAGRYVTYRIVW
jgi:DNA-directed RNA polymerase I, II, and III subunit RPABC1